MTVSDFIFEFLIEKNIKCIFAVTGGQAMYLNDAMARRQDKIKTIFTHHEQTCTMSADSYGRLTNTLGVAVVTAGPGAINAVNGLVGGYCDSAPMMVISGQSALNCVEYQEKSEIRQYGIQGIFIKPFVEKGTKYFKTVDDPSNIRYYMEEAYYQATHGRKGPVWIDVPIDVQRMEVPANLLSSYNPNIVNCSLDDKKKILTNVVSMIENSKRPLVIAGQGISLSNSQSILREFIEKHQIPIITTRLGIDIINSDSNLYIGRPGNYGERSANFAVQNADLLIVLGSRLSTSSIGHNSKDFGRNAKKIVVDIDKKELEKPIFNIDIAINDDVNCLLRDLLSIELKVNDMDKDWLYRCREWKEKYGVVLDEYKNKSIDGINSYYFTERLSFFTDNKSVILVDTGSCFHVACQVWKVKPHQRFLTTGGLSSMGYWVAGIGACLANNFNSTVVITGDGSLQMNIQEFATIKHNELPIKIFVYDNDGYLLIRQTQKNFMENRFFGESGKTGVWCPNAIDIANAYGIKTVSIENIDEIDSKLQEVLDYDGPVVCNVKMPKWQQIIPRVSSDKMADGTLISRKFEDMYPFLDEEEFKKAMIINTSENINGGGKRG